MSFKKIDIDTFAVYKLLHDFVYNFFYEIGDKRAYESPDGKRSVPPMDIRNTKGVLGALPVF